MISLIAMLVVAAPLRSVELNVASSRVALEGPLLVRLTQEGFVVFPKGQPAGVKIRIADLGAELRIEVEGGGQVQTATVAAPPTESVAELQLEVTQKAIALARAVPPEPEAPPPPAKTVTAPAPPTPDLPHSIEWDVRLDVGLLAGEFIATPVLVQAGLRAGRSLAAHLVGGLFPSSGDASGPSPGFLVEGGVGYRFRPGWRVAVEPVLLAGVTRFNDAFAALVLTPGLMAGVQVNDSVHVGVRGLFAIRFADLVFRGPGYFVDLGAYLSFRFW